jgi:hypothetical protein
MDVCRRQHRYRDVADACSVLAYQCPFPAFDLGEHVDVVAVVKLAGDLGIDERGAAVDIGGVGDDVGRRRSFVARRLRDPGASLRLSAEISAAK